MDKQQLWPSEGPCRLCGAVGALCRSHILPKFVGDWLRDTGILGRLRGSDVPNKLVEDLPWRYLLCPACEARFNRFETEVCESIFLPMHNREQDRFRYGPSFTRFAVSVAWRSLVVLEREDRLGHLVEMNEQVRATESVWRDYLLERRPSPAPHDVHVLPLDVPLNADLRGVSPHFGRFILRSCAQVTMCRDGYGYVMVKMARFLVFGTVEAGSQRAIWKGTKLHPSGGAWGVDDFHVPDWAFEWLKQGAQEMQDTMEGLSLRQTRGTRRSLAKALRADPDAFATSDIVKAWDADVRSFGKSAFQRSFPEDDQ